MTRQPPTPAGIAAAIELLRVATVGLQSSEAVVCLEAVSVAIRRSDGENTPHPIGDLLPGPIIRNGVIERWA